MKSLLFVIGVPDGGAGGAAAPPGRNSNSLGGKALMSEEEPERGILMSLPHQRIKHIKQMNLRATIVYEERTSRRNQKGLTS